MFELKFDLTAFERRAKELGQAIDQVPFALSTAMNDAAKAAKQELIDDTWGRHIHVRNQRFAGWALRIIKADKHNLRIEINDEAAGGRGHMLAHAKGGRHVGKGLTAVPSSQIAARRTSGGVPKALRPRNIPNTFKRGFVIYQRLPLRGRKKKRARDSNGRFMNTGGRKFGHLKLLYVLKPSTPFNPDVPFFEDFATVMRREIASRFPGAMKAAMRTRLPR